MILIIDYGLGNLNSILNMLRKIGAEAFISSKVEDIEKAKKLILSGVGSFDNGMKNLFERGMLPILNAKILQEKTPILGICLGMQLFTQRSEEGRLPGLAWLGAETIRFRFDAAQSLKIPHMGWNSIQIYQQHPIFFNIESEPRFYFVHSYHLAFTDPSMILAQSHYGYNFPSVVVKGNILGVQFHPEKSHKFGMKLLKNFAERF